MIPLRHTPFANHTLLRQKNTSYSKRRLGSSPDGAVFLMRLTATVNFGFHNNRFNRSAADGNLPADRLFPYSVFKQFLEECGKTLEERSNSRPQSAERIFVGSFIARRLVIGF